MGATRQDIWRCYYSTLTTLLQARIVAVNISPPQKQLGELHWAQSPLVEATFARSVFFCKLPDNKRIQWLTA